MGGRFLALSVTLLGVRHWALSLGDLDMGLWVAWAVTLPATPPGVSDPRLRMQDPAHVNLQVHSVSLTVFLFLVNKESL